MHSDTYGARIDDGAVIEVEINGQTVTALVLLAWTVVGLVAARVTFRWVRRDG